MKLISWNVNGLRACLTHGFAESFAADLLQRTKAALEAAGYIATVDMETYDKETGRTQIALIAETEGAEYG